MPTAPRLQPILTALLFSAVSLSCASVQYRALSGRAAAPLLPLPRYDALGSNHLLTPSVEQWALYDEGGPDGVSLLTAVLIGTPNGWAVELSRRTRNGHQRRTLPLSSDDDPFLRCRATASGVRIDAQVPAGRFVGAHQSGAKIYHPRVPILGLVRGEDREGRSWRLLRFGLDRPPPER
jgi:hypothetical protein